MRFYLKLWVLGGIEGIVEIRENRDFEVESFEAAKEKMKEATGELEVKHHVSDRFVRARLYQEVASW